MKNQGQLLWRLQELKQVEAVALTNEKLKPLAKNLKELQRSVKNGEEALQMLDEKIDEANKKTIELEKGADLLTKQIENSKEKLYDGKGGALKELLSLQQSVLKLEEESKKTETRYWDSLKLIEQYKEEKEKLQERIKALKSQYNEGVREYKKRKEQLEWKLAELKSKEEEVVEQLSPEAIKMYKEAAKRDPLNFIAKLQKSTCSGCRIGVSSLLAQAVKSGKGFYYCDNCGRILINVF